MTNERMDSLGEWLAGLLEANMDLDRFPPATEHLLLAAEASIGTIPDELRQLLKISNGLSCRSFRLLSVFDRDALKKTWDSLERNNDPSKAKVFTDPQFYQRFLVFADIGNGFAMFDRNDQSIWFTETMSEYIEQTTLSLRGFIETMVEHAE